MRTRLAVAVATAGMALATTGAAATGMALAPHHTTIAPGHPVQPYCLVDRDTAGYGYVTVAGPRDGYVTTNTGEAGTLTPVGGQYADEVGPDADPYGAILYNVRVTFPMQPVAVDGIVCETT